jgi:septation ring formation regulator EzrA
MTRSLSHFIGTLLIAASVAGLAISLFGVISVWRIDRSMIQEIDSTLALLDTTLQATSDGINLAQQSLDQANASLATLITTIETTGQSVHDTIPLIETLNQVATKKVPETISKTQAALTSAEASAQAIDSTLTLISSIPFLSVQPYDTQTPLAGALKEVSASLDPIAESLSSMDQSLQDSSTNLANIEKQFVQIAADLKAINKSVAEAETITAQYLKVVAALQDRVNNARNKLPATLNGLAWFITIVLIWLGLTQIGLMMQGLEMMGLEFLKQDPKTPSDQSV